MNKKTIYAIIALIIILLSIYIYSKSNKIDTIINNKNDTNMDQVINTNKVKISTSMGDIVIEFNTTAPKTVENFKTLMSKSFYDGVRFHRVIKDFMIQTGDPNSKDITKVNTWGMGGPGYKFADELSGKEQYTYGTVAMANSGPDTNGSQFFIVSAKQGAALPPNYTVFAHVVSGMDIVDRIQSVKTTGRSSSPNDKPLEDILITSVKAE